MKIISLLFVILSFSALAQDAVIAVGKAEQEKDKLVIDDPEMTGLNGDQKRLASELTEILRNDFAFYKHKFETIEYFEKGKNSYSTPTIEKWKGHGLTYFIASSVGVSGQNIESRYKAYSVLTGRELFSASFKVSHESLRNSAHAIADSIYRSMTGKPSIFNSKIVFVSDRTTTNKNDIQKELYLMDFDGRRVEKLTDFKSVVISPSISPDNSRIMFSLISAHKEVSRNKVRTIKNNHLKMYDLRSKHISTVSSKPGINSGAIFSARGNSIYLTLSFSGNADIYEMDLATDKLRKITTHYGDDVDPSVTRDGSLMTFLSNRSGRAHIYTMDPSSPEKDVKRISFVGQFNATPRFSPDGKEIAFSSWVDNGFDLYRIDSTGNNLSRLTKNFGSNEEPVFSPDGEFIVFTSKKMVSKSKAAQDVYIMNREGEIMGQLTQNFGRCFSPQWTNLSK
jgi:TolB protein